LLPHFRVVASTPTATSTPQAGRGDSDQSGEAPQGSGPPLTRKAKIG